MEWGEHKVLRRAMYATRSIKEGEAFFVERAPLFHGRLLGSPMNEELGNACDLTHLAYQALKTKSDASWKNHMVSTKKIAIDMDELQRCAKMCGGGTTLADVIQVVSVLQDNMFRATFPIVHDYLDCYMYDLASYVNHRCVRYAANYVIDPVSGAITFYARRDLQKGEEVTISYAKNLRMVPVAVRRAILQRDIGFECACVDCAEKYTDPFQRKLCGIPIVPLGEVVNDVDSWCRKHKDSVQHGMMLMGWMLVTLTEQLNKNIRAQRVTKWPKISEKACATLSSWVTRFDDTLDLMCQEDTGAVMTGHLAVMMCTRSKDMAKAHWIRLSLLLFRRSVALNFAQDAEHEAVLTIVRCIKCNKGVFE